MSFVHTTPDIAPLDIDCLADEPPALPPPDQLHVWVLIDGDQCIFNPEGYLSRGEEGGRDAAKMIAEFVHKEFGERTDFVLLTYVFWNLNGLMNTLRNNNYAVTWENMKGFIHGFQHPAFNYCINTGRGKESADSKLHALFRDNLRSCRTKHIYVGFSDDQGYDTEFRKEVVEKYSSRIGLIKGHKYSHPPMTLKCQSHEIKGLFLEEKLSNQRAPAGDLQRPSSSADNWREPRVPMTPDRIGGLPLPFPSGESSNGGVQSKARDGASSAVYVPPSKRNSLTVTASSFTHRRNISLGSPRGSPSSKMPSPHSAVGPADHQHSAPSGPLTPASMYTQDSSPRKQNTAFSGEQDPFSPGYTLMNERHPASNGVTQQTPTLPVELFRVHSMICPSIDDSNLTFSPTSCTDANRCSYEHRCPFGSECAFRKAGVCNFPEGLDGDAVE